MEHKVIEGEESENWEMKISKEMSICTDIEINKNNGGVMETEVEIQKAK